MRNIRQELVGDFEWYNVELTQKKAEEFKDWLRCQNIYFEPSSAGPLVHFECLMNPFQKGCTNMFLKELDGI